MCANWFSRGNEGDQAQRGAALWAEQRQDGGNSRSSPAR
jgi:hypothetical protein